MKPQTLFIVISLLLTLLVSTPALSAVIAGKVTNLNGPLFAERIDGTICTLAKDSAVEVGDTLVTEKRTFARVVFTDASEVILRPGTRFKIEAMNFDPAQPQNDNLVLDAVKGGLRAITGQVGKRGNADAYQTKTASATIGIRGTVYEVRVCAGNCGGMPDGIYFFVVQGMIEVTNRAGSVTIGPGEYAYARDQDSLPVVIPEPSDIDFTLPDDWAKGAGLEDWVSNPGGGRSCEIR